MVQLIESLLNLRTYLPYIINYSKSSLTILFKEEQFTCVKHITKLLFLLPTGFLTEPIEAFLGHSGHITVLPPASLLTYIGAWSEAFEEPVSCEWNTWNEQGRKKRLIYRS